MIIIFYLCVNYSSSISLNDELIHIRLNLNDGAASKIGQFEQFHFADLVKIAQLILTWKNEYVSVHTAACTVYNSDWGSTYDGYKSNIFFNKKKLFLHQNKLFTQTFSGKVTFFGKICKNLFRQGAILHFQYYLLNFLPIFQNKFLTIVNAIYILYEAKLE